MARASLPGRKRAQLEMLDRMTKRFTPQIREAFLAAIDDVKSGVILDQLIAAIGLGDVNKAFQLLGFNDAAMRPITRAIERAFEDAGDEFGAAIPRRHNRAVFRFDLRNPRSETYLRQHSSDLVTRITFEQRELVRVKLNEAMRDGVNPRNTALDIVGRIDPITGRRVGGVVGLSGPQERFVANARADFKAVETMPRWFTRTRRDKRFDGIVRKAIEAGELLPADKVDKLITRYSDSLLQLRGETIARTETISALNRSQQEAYTQAIEQGTVARDAVKRIWDSSGNDGRTRDTHLAMDGQAVGMDEPFKTPDGFSLMFPGDVSLGAPPEETINCRCRVRMQVDFLAGVE